VSIRKESGRRRFEGSYWFHLQGQAVQGKYLLPLALEMKELRFIVAPVIMCQSTRHTVSTNLNLQEHHCEDKHRTSCFYSAHFNVSSRDKSDSFTR
jgi:hypothetical protein